MRQAAMGFAAGSIVTAVAFLLIFDVAPQAVPPTAVSTDESSDAVAPAPFSVATAPAPPSTVPGAERPESRTDSRTSDEDAGAFLEPIRTPPEFDFISEDQPFWHHDNWRIWHERLEREPRDPQWSYATEAALNSAISEQPELTRYGTPVVNCRSRTCQVQLLAVGANDIDDGEWSSLFGSVYGKLRDDFEMAEFSVAKEGGISAMVLHIHKRELPPAEPVP